MKRLLLLVAATALLVAPSLAQTRDDITIPEFRQVLVDLGSYLDAHKGTDLARQFEAMPEEGLRQIYPSVANPRQFQRAVAALRKHDAEGAQAEAKSRGASASPMVVYTDPSCQPPNTFIIDNPPAACNPAYPDPTNSAWQNLVNPLITFGAFSPTDYPDVSMQSCSLTVESNLSQVVSALNGTVTVAAIACGALPPIASNVCFGAVAVVGVAGAVSQGLFNDCTEQDGNVNAAEIDAAFHNTVTIYDALGSSSTATLAGDISNSTTTLATDISTSTTTLASDVSAVSTQLTNVNTQITSEFGALSAQLTAALTQLTNQLTNTTALLDAQLKQVMKENLTPDGQKILDIPILTCTGINCPNVLATCQAKGNCSWNNVGPLP
jgi:hypothetical protein